MMATVGIGIVIEPKPKRKSGSWWLDAPRDGFTERAAQETERPNTAADVIAAYPLKWPSPRRTEEG